MAAVGHIERFPSPGLNAGYMIRQQTFAGALAMRATRRNRTSGRTLSKRPAAALSSLVDSQFNQV
jgi:hypothetical protein